MFPPTRGKQPEKNVPKKKSETKKLNPKKKIEELRMFILQILLVMSNILKMMITHGSF